MKHKLRFKRQSTVLYKGKPTEIDVYKCDNCEKIYIINTKTQTKISLNGLIGQEIY